MSRLSSETVGLVELENFYETQLKAANANSIKDGELSITGKGKTEDEALKDADEQAKAKFQPLQAGIESAIKAMATDFAAKRKTLAPKILTDPAGYYLKHDVHYFLRRNTTDIFVEADEFLFSSECMATLEAKSGEDYSK